MNNKRRKELSSIISRLEAIREEIEMLRDDEQEAFDNLPYSLQESDKGCNMEENVGNLDTAIGLIDDTITEMEEAKDR